MYYISLQITKKNVLRIRLRKNTQSVREVRRSRPPAVLLAGSVLSFLLNHEHASRATVVGRWKGSFSAVFCGVGFRLHRAFYGSDPARWLSG